MNSSATRHAQRVRARDVVRAVEQDERMTPDDFEPSRRAHRREALAHRIVVERRTRERLGGGERDRRVVGLVRAVEREEHVDVARVLGV